MIIWRKWHLKSNILFFPQRAHLQPFMKTFSCLLEIFYYLLPFYGFCILCLSILSIFMGYGIFSHLWKHCLHYLYKNSNDSYILIFLFRYFVKLKLFLKIFIPILLHNYNKRHELWYFLPIFSYFTYLCCIITLARNSGSMLTNRSNS